MRAATLRRLINFWPPFLFTGIRANHISADFRAVDVSLTLRWYNRNYVGTHFGGSLFAMTDPWYMLMLVQNLGADYFVWDRHSAIDFLAPGRGVVRAQFRIDQALLEGLREATAGGEKTLPEFVVDIVGADGAVVAQVHKTVYVRRKPGRR